MESFSISLTLGGRIMRKSVDNYRRRHFGDNVLDGLTLMFLFALIWFVMWVASGALSAGFTCDTRPITVQSGDTLDGIVREFCAGTVTDALDQVVRVYGATIYPNTVVYLPSSDRCTLTLDDAGQVYENCSP